MSRLWGKSAIGTVLFASIFPQLAAAEDPPFDPAIDVQLYEYAVGPKTFLSIADADVAAKKQFAADMFVTYLTNPLTVYNVAPGEDMLTGTRTQVVESLLGAQVSGAYGLSEKLQVQAMLPLVLSLQGEGLDPTTAMPANAPIKVTGTGDLIAEVKYRFYNKDNLRMAGIGGLSLPSSFGSGDSQFIGDDLPTVRGRLATQYSVGKLSVGANLGLVFRKPRTIYASTVGQTMTWGVAASYRAAEKVAIIAETFGRTGLAEFDLDKSPLEAGGGLRVQATSSVAVVAGGGAGLVKGIGAPDFRAFLSFGYSPDIRDNDRDGVNNSKDLCPSQTEDKDGFEDSDGCPEDDNDGDKRPDATDKCPNKAEDLDGFDDDDGCPELDNDADGIEDLADKCMFDKEDGAEPHPKDGCPLGMRDSDGDGIFDSTDKCLDQAEDMDEFEDSDGCPEADNDADGIADATDQCALCAEDKDGNQDDDGCPEFDDDKDGVPDEADKCPKEPETINGVNDGDGCPDTGGTVSVVFADDALTVSKAPTFDAKGLTKQGLVVVDMIALVMNVNSDVTSWVLALSDKGDVAAKAAFVKARLIEKGVPEAKFQLLTAPGSAKIGGAARERVAPEDTPKTCPVEKQVQPKVPNAAPSAVPTPATPATPATTK